MQTHDRERLRVVFVSTTYPSADHPRRNIFTHRSIKALDSEIDAEVIEFVSWKRGRQPLISSREYDGIPITSFACPRLPWPKASHLNALIRVYVGKHLLQSQLKLADVIHAAALYPAGFIADRWAQSIGKPCTAHAIGSDVNVLLPQVRKSLLSHLPWHIDGIVCNSNDMMKKVKTLFPGHQNVRVIYRGVDTEKYSPSNTEGNNSFPGVSLRFLFLGGFHTWDSNHPSYNVKGGPLLLQAWQRVADQIAPDMLFVGGPGVDDYRVELEKWRAALSRPESVSFLSLLHPDSVPQVIRDSDVVVIPSTLEGLPNLAREAQACGCPVLGTDSGGIPEAVVHKKTGIIVPRGDIDALAAGLLWFHTNRNTIRGMGLNAREHMLQEFSWERFSKEMLDSFYKAIQTHTA